MLKVSVLTTILLSTAATNTFAAVGTVTEQTGPTEIQRKSQAISSQIKTAIEMQDTVVTANAKVNITFRDNSKVEITEQSKLVIDDFVYDASKADAGKVGLKMALGTARFASGQIAKNNPQNIKIETPTATIGVRGTDFSLTVDEIGRSLVILLPSCPVGWKDLARDCVTGEIFVKTSMGIQYLNRPFQSVNVGSREGNPSRPNILNLSLDQINNLLILTPPKEKKEEERKETRSALDINFLEQDFLKYDGLSTNLLDVKSKLDINYLDQDWLLNELEINTSSLLQNELNEPDDPILPNFKRNRALGLRAIYDFNTLTLYRNGLSGWAEISVDKDVSTTVKINQDNLNITQNINRVGGTVITVTQTR